MRIPPVPEHQIRQPAPSTQAPPGAAKLSARERELVTLVARGRTDARIAAELFISVRTVGSHLDRIRDSRPTFRQWVDYVGRSVDTGPTSA